MRLFNTEEEKEKGGIMYYVAHYQDGEEHEKKEFSDFKSAAHWARKKALDCCQCEEELLIRKPAGDDRIYVVSCASSEAWVEVFASCQIGAGDTKGYIFEQVLEERARQDSIWGEQNHDHFTWLSILGEEVGEVHKAALECAFGEGCEEDYIEKLVQVIAVAFAMIECVLRKRGV